MYLQSVPFLINPFQSNIVPFVQYIIFNIPMQIFARIHIHKLRFTSLKKASALISIAHNLYCIHDVEFDRAIYIVAGVMQVVQ